MLLGNKVNGRICDLQVELAKPCLLEVLIYADADAESVSQPLDDRTETCYQSS